MTYGSGDRAVTALSDVSLTVSPGEFIALIGPSGCGKSTVLRIVADIITPTAGDVAVCGRAPRDARLARSCSFVFQEPVLLPWRNVRENVGLPLELVGVSPNERRQRVGDLLRIVQLEGFDERMPRELSGGMRMRASLARALTQNPAILLMDEPFGALDEITRLQMNLELLRVWGETNSAVLFVTHSIDEAVFLADQVVVMSARPGRIVEKIPINLPRPRQHATLTTGDDFQHLCQAVRRVLYAG